MNEGSGTIFFFFFYLRSSNLAERGSGSLRRFLVTYCEISLSLRRRLRNYLFYENILFVSAYEQISLDYIDYLAPVIANLRGIN